MLNRLQWLAVMLGSGLILDVAPVGAETKATAEKMPAVLQVRDFPRSSVTVEEWLSQQPVRAIAPIRVIEVKLNPTQQGLEVILQTETGEALQATQQADGNTLILTVPNAVLVRQPVDSEKPVEGIDRVSVTQADATSIRVSITGLNDLPTAEIVPGQGLVLAVTPEAGEEEEITVTGETQGGYRVPNSSTVTRTDTPLRDIPQSIQILPQELLRDQRADITSALLNAPSVGNDAPTNFDSFRIFVRGFPTTATVNGFKDTLNSVGIGPDLTGIERIEVLQGPNSILFGSSSPGGTVNFVTKQPLRDPYYFAEFTAGNFNFYRGEIDFSGPLDSSKTVLYRLNASYRDQEFSTDLSRTSGFVIAPSVSFVFSERTKLTIEGSYRDFSFRSLSFGLPAVGTILSNPNGRIPRNLNINEGTLSATGTRFGYTLDHKLSETWSIRNAFQYSQYQSGYGGTDAGTFPIGLLPDNRTLERVTFNEDSSQRDIRISTNVVGKFATGQVQHQLLLGFDVGRVTAEFSGQDREITLFDLFNPVYGRTFGETTFEFSNRNVTNELGFLVQDQITLASNLKLVIGGRFDLFSQRNSDILADTSTRQSGSAFSPRVGVVYQPIQPISLYANYSRSFQPAIGQAFDGSDFQPSRGTQVEVGVKADISDRLSTTLAFYNITQSNVLTDDPDNLGFRIQTGGQRSRGIELSLAGEISSGWKIFASYAYNDGRVTQDNSIPVGNRLRATPAHAASLWTTYEIQRGSLRGLGFGLGLFYVGDRPADLQNTLEVPSYLTTDAAVFFKRNQFRAAVNIKNLFNIDYFESAFNSLRVSPGAPLTVQGSMSWTF